MQVMVNKKQEKEGVNGGIAYKFFVKLLNS